MTQTVTVASVAYSGDGIVVAFNVPFHFDADTEVHVRLINDTTDVQVTQTNPTNYSVSGGPGAGVITMVVAPATGESLTIERRTVQTQTLDLTRGGVLDAEILEARLDIMTRAIQDLQDRGQRSLKRDSRGGLTSVYRAGGRVIKDGADAVDPTDLVTKQQSDAAAASVTADAAAAAASAAAALVSEVAAEASFDNFDDIYLGPKASNPTLDNDGDALQTGALYFNTVAGEMRIFDVSVWVTAFNPSPSTVDSVFGRVGAVTANAGDYTAAQVDNVPGGGIGAGTVQGAIDELDTEKQPIDATLTALAGLATGADKLAYSTGVDTFAQANLTLAGRNLIDDSSAVVQRTTLSAQLAGARLDDINAVTPAKGSVLAATAAALALLPVGANDEVLTADSAETLGLKWAVAAAAGGFKSTQQFTATGTWTRPVGVTKIIVIATAPGGGGGGDIGTNQPGDGGGGAGATAIETIDVTSTSSAAITIGSVGTGGNNADGGTGGSCQFGSFVTALGGVGGGTAADAFHAGPGGLGGAVSVAGDIDIFGGDGAPGGYGDSTIPGHGGNGGASFWGSGGRGGEADDSARSGAPGRAYGSGGGGANGNSSAADGGAGAGGIIWILEFS